MARFATPRALIVTALLTGCSASPGAQSTLAATSATVTVPEQSPTRSRDDDGAPTCKKTPRIYVPLNGQVNPKHRPFRWLSKVVVFSADAQGNTAPLKTIQGRHSQMDVPTGIAVDDAGRVYVDNIEDGSVTIYGPRAAGKKALPIQTIGGSNTGLWDPIGVAVDRQENIYILNKTSSSQQGYVTVYAAGSNGNVAPVRTIKGSTTGLDWPWGIALDGDDNIYVANGSFSKTMAA